jgi:hypothetical protein
MVGLNSSSYEIWMNMIYKNLTIKNIYVNIITQIYLTVDLMLSLTGYPFNSQSDKEIYPE